MVLMRVETCVQAVRGEGEGEGVEDDRDLSVTLEDLVGQPDADLQLENLPAGKGFGLDYNLRSRYSMEDWYRSEPAMCMLGSPPFADYAGPAIMHKLDISQSATIYIVPA